MEAERELPPALRLAFTRDPRALEGWESHDAERYRPRIIICNLLLSFARGPAVDVSKKVVDEAIAIAEKKSDR